MWEDYLGGGGEKGAKGMLPPPSKIIGAVGGGGGWPPWPLSSYAYAKTINFFTCSKWKINEYITVIWVIIRADFAEAKIYASLCDEIN